MTPEHPLGPGPASAPTPAPTRPAHPRATTAMVLGIIGLTGVMCVLPFVVSPLAWYFGAVARRETARHEDRWAPSGAATAGVVTGAIGTVLLVAGTVVLLGIAILTWTVHSTESGYGG